MRRSQSLFWGVRVNDEGCVRPNSFHSLVTSGEIEVIAPARVVGYADDGKQVIINNGRVITTKCVLLGTGYQSSWTNIFKCLIPFLSTYRYISLICPFLAKMAQEIGIDRHAPQMEVMTKWDYKTLANAPAPNPEYEWVTSIYRGLIPAKNIEKRDFAIAGATVWDS